MNYKIISVESRKGGVGKTTAALNLSSLLLEMGYAVLLIDVDITGTNIKYALESTYWRDKKNIVKISENGDNLLRLYKECFMIGKLLPKWQIASSNDKEEDFVIIKDKINIFGSEIYDMNGKNRLICNPSILFDELHAYWFVEFLKKLCDSFSTECGKDKTVIIFDNSPGYVGINPEIHEWLTDIGTANGKFLTISSLDEQDFLSCSKAIKDLHSMFKNKLSGAKKYIEAKKNIVPKFDPDNKEEKQFYQRLISDSVRNEFKILYQPSIINNADIDRIKFYQALLINKVILEIRDNLVSFNFNESIGKENDEFNELLDLHNIKSKNNNIVYYDDNINFQFYQSSMIVDREYSNKYSLRTLKGQFTNLENSIRKIEDNYLQELDKGKMKTPMGIDPENDIILFSKKVKMFQDKLESLIDNISRNMPWNTSKLIDNEWFPQAPLNRIRHLFNDFLDEYEIYDYDLRNPNDDRYVNFEMIHFIYREFRELEGLRFEEDDFENTQQSLRNNVIIIGLIATALPFKFVKHEGIMFFREFVSFQVRRANEIYRGKKRKRDLSFRDFLISEISNEEKDYMEYEKLFYKLDFPMRIREENAVEFYKAVCRAQLRYIDIDKDIKFFINVMRTVTFDNELSSDTLYPNIKPILDSVIIDKTIPHSRADNELLKSLKSARYMKDFQEVLKNILVEWKMGNE
ncbi:MAG: AAA family ATPase [Candidatus Cloacimonetes bacterium]|nr:AAA family ATPase [Candidatus Cloacimonadota bacterium]